MDVNRFVVKVRNNLDKVLIGLAALTLVAAGWQIYDYRSYVDCQIKVNDSVVKALDANEGVSRALQKSMDVILAQPPRSREEQRAVLVELQAALNRRQQVMATVPPVPSEGCR